MHCCDFTAVIMALSSLLLLFLLPLPLLPPPFPLHSPLLPLLPSLWGQQVHSHVTSWKLLPCQVNYFPYFVFLYRIIKIQFTALQAQFSFYSFLKIFTYFQRERKEKEGERIIIVWLPLAHPQLGPGLQPRHVP